MEIKKLDIPWPDPVTHAPRGKGVHLSDILDGIERDLGQEYQQNWDQETLFCMGYAVEAAIELGLAHTYTFRPPEIVKDGIIMSPDGFNPDEWVIDEYKSTFKTLENSSPDKIWKWMAQNKGYCMGIGRNPETNQYPQARFFVLSVNMHRGEGPKRQAYSIKYTDQEIEDNWAMVLNYKATMEEENGDNS